MLELHLILGWLLINLVVQVEQLVCDVDLRVYQSVVATILR